MISNRLYVVEPTPSVLGLQQTTVCPCECDVELFARALAGKLGIAGAAAFSGETAKWLETVVTVTE
jgi:hypothetical protein